jgi:Peptidase family M23/Putative peptidoglycan binding domain
VVDLTRTGTLLRCPGGNVEVPGAQKAAGIQWAALNIGNDPCVNRDPTVWKHQRDLYRDAGIPCGPWMHVRSMADLEFLIQTGLAWTDAAFVGCNVENIVGDGLSLKEIGGYLLDFWVGPTNGKPVHMPTLAWVQNSQDWQAVDFCVVALELFPKEQPAYCTPEAIERCINHAFDEGLKKVTLLYSTTSPRSAYPAAVAHCLYTADNVTDWSEWKDSVPQPLPRPPKPPSPPEVPMLTEKQFPYTGPMFGPGPKQTMNHPTVKGLKRAMIRLGRLDQELGTETDDYGPDLRAAMKAYQANHNLTPRGDYGRGTWLLLRNQKIPTGTHKGEWAMDSLALKYVRDDLLTMCYPHPEGALSSICQGLHPTAGVPGNWAIDFCAPGGTEFLAVERGEIVKLSGHDPVLPPNNAIGIWGWTIYLQTAAGYTYFATHFGSRNVKVGQIVEVGQPIATVGRWPGDPGRSHTHLGVSSPFGIADAKKHITAISLAPHIPLL